ncbi:HAAS domain-containing protein [Spiroplasma alleghenense]|uniref:DUF1700 domain-containing protein n=1 Tax=Spiroplasma alleghenense TaxID=216931 RepID=A0A345Z5C1_9MOLU|nr:DUF1700 domain-containing protein [Spiroplasma alleghenense]AXK51800.1 hypothetical protein SALLE_v1c11300 [Spiroplasma alleghenense]
MEKQTNNNQAPSKLEARFKRKKDKWLKNLRCSLSLLEPEDCNDIVNSYNEKISVELAEGSVIEDILESMESIETIRNNVYAEFGIDPQKKVVNKSEKSIGKSFTAWILNIFVVFFGIGLPMILALTFFIAAIATIVAIVPFIVFMFINYDFIKVLPVVIAGIGILPLMTILSWYIMIGLYKLGTNGTNGFLFLAGSDKRVKSKVKKINVFSRVVLIITVIVFSAAATSGTIATFVGQNSFGNSLIHQRYFYETGATLNVEDKNLTHEKEFNYFDFKLVGFPHGNGFNFVINDTRQEGDNSVKEVTATFKHFWRQENIGDLNIELIESETGTPKFRIELDYFSWTILVASFGEPTLEVNIS